RLGGIRRPVVEDRIAAMGDVDAVAPVVSRWRTGAGLVRLADRELIAAVDHLGRRARRGPAAPGPRIAGTLMNGEQADAVDRQRGGRVAVEGGVHVEKG